MKRTKAERECLVCKKSFVPKKIDSKYCTPKCGDIAYRKKKALEKKEQQIQTVAKISNNRLYISVSEATTLFDITRSTLYRFVRLKRLPAMNLGTRLTRVEYAALEEMFPIRKTPIIKEEKPKAKLYSLEPEDCYTIGEITEKFGISNTSVYTHIRKYSIPTRQIGKYVYAPKSEIDHLYK